MTSAAPILGCTPFCVVKSINSAALPAPRTAASTTASGAPAIVTTERLWSGSIEKSNRCTPSTCIARTISWIFPASVPSEKFGTHSTIGPSFISFSPQPLCRSIPYFLISLPPAIPNRKLQTQIHARVFISKACTGNMHRICGKVYRPSGAQKVMRPHASLRRKVPYAGIRLVPGLGGIGKVQVSHRRKLMVRPDDPARTLYPRHPSLPMRQIPAQDDRRDTRPGKLPAHGIRSRTLRRARNSRRAEDPRKLRRIRLPQRKYLHRILKISLEQPRPNLRRQCLPRMSADHEEAEVRAVLKAHATLHQSTKVPRICVRQRTHRRHVRLTLRDTNPGRKASQQRGNQLHTFHSSSQSKAASV